MIKAKPYQQQPPNAVECEHCGDRFNNKLRMIHHKNREDTTCVARVEDKQEQDDE